MGMSRSARTAVCARQQSTLRRGMVTIAVHSSATREPDQQPHGPAAAVRHPVREFVRNYTWAHTTLGLVGNSAFLIGSVFFLFEELKTAGTWLFIVGAAGMFIGAIGRALVTWEESGTQGS